MANSRVGGRRNIDGELGGQGFAVNAFIGRSGEWLSVGDDLWQVDVVLKVIMPVHFPEGSFDIFV